MSRMRRVKEKYAITSKLIFGIVIYIVNEKIRGNHG
jgi:hypothetical protein